MMILIMECCLWHWYIVLTALIRLTANLVFWYVQLNILQSQNLYKRGGLIITIILRDALQWWPRLERNPITPSDFPEKLFHWKNSKF